MMKVRAYRFVDDGTGRERRWTQFQVRGTGPEHLGEFLIDKALAQQAHFASQRNGRQWPMRRDTPADRLRHIGRTDTPSEAARLVAFQRASLGQRRLFPYAVPPEEAGVSHSRSELGELFDRVEAMMDAKDTRDAHDANDAHSANDTHNTGDNEVFTPLHETDIVDFAEMIEANEIRTDVEIGEDTFPTSPLQRALVPAYLRPPIKQFVPDKDASDACRKVYYHLKNKALQQQVRSDVEDKGEKEAV